MGSLVVADLTDYIRRRTAEGNMPTNATVSMAGWFKRATSTAGTDRYICSCTNGTSGPKLAFWNVDNKLRMAEVTTNAFSDPQPAVDTWAYFAFSHNGAANPTGYWWLADGTFQSSQIATFSSSFDTETATDMVVGNRSSQYDLAHVGKYAYWKVWNAALTQAEFEAEQFSPTFVRTANANTGFADSATDISGNGRDWILGGIGTDADTPPVELEAAAAPDLYVTRSNLRLR
jgi:hypothetical protein